PHYLIRDYARIFLLRLPLPLSSTLFPYTTLFRSELYRIGRVVIVDFLDSFLQPVLINQVVKRFRVSTELIFPGKVLLDRPVVGRSEEHTSELQSRENLV